MHARGLTLSAFLALTVTLYGLSAHTQDHVSATVTSVVDGDAIKVQIDAGSIVTVRLIGIDTPETKHPSKPVQCFGAETSAKTAELLPPGTRIELESDVQALDRYGRNLAYVWREGGMLMVNQQLVAEGYALTLTISPNVKYTEQFTAGVEAARANGLGLWSACAGTAMEASDDAPVLNDTPPATVPQSQPVATPQPAPKRPTAGDMNCTDFRSQADAQAALRSDPSDPWDLDRDGDGIACETRPAPKDTKPVPR